METVNYKPYQQRVVDEKAELDDRLSKLKAFCFTAMFDELDLAEQNRLRLQEQCMASYSAVLGERIAAFK